MWTLNLSSNRAKLKLDLKLEVGFEFKCDLKHDFELGLGLKPILELAFETDLAPESYHGCDFNKLACEPVSSTPSSSSLEG